MTERTKREYSIDLLRFLSMLGIIMIHLIDQGGILKNISIGNFKYFIIQFVYIIVYTSVNIFGIISGYLYINKEKISHKNIVSLIFTAFFYTSIITGIFYGFNLFNVRALGIVRLISSIFPPIVGRYWYITCYVVVFFLIPYINITLKKINKKQTINLLIILFLLFSIITTFGVHDYFIVNRGHSPIWLIYCYCVGAYLGKYKRNYDVKKCILYLMLIILGLTIITCIALLYTNRLEKHLISHNSPFILISSILIFIIISSIKMNKNSVIDYLSKVSFGVYLIHANILIYDFLIKDSLCELSKYNCIIIVLCTLGIALLIYFLCLIIELIRIYLFKKTKIDQLVLYIGAQIDKKNNI